MEEEASEIFDLRNEANKSFAVNETTIMLCRTLQSNRGARGRTPKLQNGDSLQWQQQAPRKGSTRHRCAAW